MCDHMILNQIQDAIDPHLRFNHMILNQIHHAIDPHLRFNQKAFR